ncbi:MAG TPA: phosphoglycolate phosphatase [Sutterella sp.]|nr:phosphoglycolate phosphatase [Sutterella sp.]
MQIKAVLFDLDGTLIDTIPDLTYGLNQMLKGFDRPPLTTKQVSSMVGRGVIDLMENVFRASRLVVCEEAIKQAISVYCDIMVRSGSLHSTIFPDVFDSLSRLRKSGMKLAIVTNKPRSMTEAIVKEKNLDECVDCIVAAGDAATVKPHPEMLWLACDRLSVSRKEAVMVGDSSNDALAAKSAGMPVYLVTTGYNGTESVAQWAKENGFTRVFDAIQDVTDDILNRPQD